MSALFMSQIDTFLVEVEAMPIGLEQWRAGVGSNSAGRSHALGKFMRRKCPRSFLIFSYLLIITEDTWFSSDDGTFCSWLGNHFVSA